MLALLVVASMAIRASRLSGDRCAQESAQRRTDAVVVGHINTTKTLGQRRRHTRNAIVCSF